MKAFLVAVFGFVLIQFRHTEREEKTDNGLFEMMAKSPPSKTPRELHEIVHSAHFPKMDVSENAVLLEHMVLSLIKPGMSQEEVFYAKTTFIAPIVNILALQSVGAQGGISGQQVI